MTQYDVVVIGGGMVGAAAALGLARQKKKVALVEGYAPQEFSPEQAMDLRISAISKTSIDLLKSLRAWESIESKRIHPYSGLETWELDTCRTRFAASDIHLSELGVMAENRILQLGLWEQFDDFDNLDVFCPDTLDKINFAQEKSLNRVYLSSGKVLETAWILGCDGANSKVREMAGIGITAWDYRQRCMLINVKTVSKIQHHTTWQCFYPSGPRSYLPLAGNQASLVWYDSPQKIKQLERLPMPELSAQIMQAFPAELGEIEALQAASFALTRRHAQKYVARGCVLLGDAAHTINPLAGQGVNLGFKDVWALLEAVADKGLTLEAMQSYESLRRKDNLLMQTGMDVFYQAFSNDILPLKLARNLGLRLAEHSGGVKNQVLKYALGL